VNFLAHCALGSQHPEYLVGGFLGDFIKGRVPAHLPRRIQVGIRLHRRLDAFSAVQPDIKMSVARFPAALRRVAPIFVDLVADHFLARHFEFVYPEPLAAFATRAYATLTGQIDQFPAPARRFLKYLTEYDVFGRYVEVDAVERAFTRIGERLGLDGIVIPAMTAFGECYTDLEEDFLRYYPALAQHAAQWLATAESVAIVDDSETAGNLGRL
jgi:acyl carrier protein phosphodiesterase